MASAAAVVSSPLARTRVVDHLAELALIISSKTPATIRTLPMLLTAETGRARGMITIAAARAIVSQPRALMKSRGDW